jgi:hypothetical protein
MFLLISGIITGVASTLAYFWGYADGAKKDAPKPLED